MSFIMQSTSAPTPPLTTPSGLQDQEVEQTMDLTQPSKVVSSDEPKTWEEIVERFTALQTESPKPRQMEQLENSYTAQIQMPQPRPLSFSGVRPSTPPKLSSSPTPFLHSPPTITKTPPQMSLNNNMSPNLSVPMVRAHSSPAYSSAAFSPSPATTRSTSPLRSPKRVRSPFRHVSVDEAFFGSAVTLSPEISSISEDAELEITPRSSHHIPSSSTSSLSATPTGASPYASLTFPRTLRRRPASPLRPLNSSRASSVPASPHLSATSIPSSAPSTMSGSGKFQESFPTDLQYYTPHGARTLSLSSSVPSTPTSARSRSPSISSLETIPDSPDAEDQAAEEDKRDREERRRMWELYGSPSQGQERERGSARSGFGNRDKRKRWSVCGAEKRSDLNLETIWED